MMNCECLPKTNSLRIECQRPAEFLAKLNDGRHLYLCDVCADRHWVGKIRSLTRIETIGDQHQEMWKETDLDRAESVREAIRKGNQR